MPNSLTYYIKVKIIYYIVKWFITLMNSLDRGYWASFRIDIC